MISLGFPVSSSPKAVRPGELALPRTACLLGRLGDRCSALVVQFGCSNEEDLLNLVTYEALKKRQAKSALNQRISPPAFCLPQRREDLPTSERHHDLPNQTAS